MKRNTALLFFLLASLCFQPKAWCEDKGEGPAFHIWLQRAYRIAVSGDLDRARILFEKLLIVNPKEWMVYDFYANALKYRGDFEGAITVYERALLLSREMRPIREDEIKDRIQTIEETKQFEESVKNIPPFSLARTFGTRQFLIRTNIPKQYYAPLVQRMAELYREEKQMFEKIFGTSKRIPSLIKVDIFGRWVEYAAFIKDLTRHTKTGVVITYPAYYDEESGILALYYNGEADWLKIAHEMAHFLIRDCYLKYPSRWLDKGLAEYIAYKLEKETAKNSVLRSLEYIQWLREQGQWQSVMELFPYWMAYERSGDPNSTLPAAKIFYLKAWSLVHFFLEGEDAFSRNFFQQYLQYEKKDGYPPYRSVFNYFRDHLTQDQIRAMDQKWGKYITGLTYENV